MTVVPTVYLPHNSVTRNLLANRLSKYGEKQGPNTGQASRENWKDGASQPRFSRAKECLRKLSVIWARTLEEIRSSCPKPKKLKEYRFEGAPNY